MVGYFASAFTLLSVLLYGCLGEIFTEKAGHLNLGIPGIMCGGAAGGILGVSLYMSAFADNASANGFLAILIGMIFSIIFAAALGLIYTVFTVTFRCNQNVTGLTLTIFGNGFSSVIIDQILVNEITSAKLSYAGLNFFTASLPFASQLGWFGEIFLNHGALTYIAIVLAILSYILLNKTKVGLNLRAIGEKPGTADSVGINVTKYKYAFILFGSALAGLGGLSYVMENMAGIIGATINDTIEGFGWLAVALVIFSSWNPLLAIVCSLAFAAFYVMPSYRADLLPNASFTFAQVKLLNMIPYVITIIVLIITSIRGKKENLGPGSLGLSYFREDR